MWSSPWQRTREKADKSFNLKRTQSTSRRSTHTSSLTAGCFRVVTVPTGRRASSPKESTARRSSLAVPPSDDDDRIFCRIHQRTSVYTLTHLGWYPIVTDGFIMAEIYWTNRAAFFTSEREFQFNHHHEFFPFLPFVFLFPPSFLLRMDGSTGRIDSAQRQPKKEAMDRRERDSAVHKQCNISIRSWIFSGSAFFFIAGNLYMEIVVVWNQGKNNSLRCFYSYSRCCCNRIFFWGGFSCGMEGNLVFWIFLLPTGRGAKLPSAKRVDAYTTPRRPASFQRPLPMPILV